MKSRLLREILGANFLHTYIRGPATSRTVIHQLPGALVRVRLKLRKLHITSHRKLEKTEVKLSLRRLPGWPVITCESGNKREGAFVPFSMNQGENYWVNIQRYQACGNGRIKNIDVKILVKKGNR